MCPHSARDYPFQLHLTPLRAAARPPMAMAVNQFWCSLAHGRRQFWSSSLQCRGQATSHSNWIQTMPILHDKASRYPWLERVSAAYSIDICLTVSSSL